MACSELAIHRALQRPRRAHPQAGVSGVPEGGPAFQSTHKAKSVTDALVKADACIIACPPTPTRVTRGYPLRKHGAQSQLRGLPDRRSRCGVVWRRGSPLSRPKNTFRSRWLAEADIASIPA